MNLKEYLESQNETMVAFAKRSGVPQPTLSRIVNGLYTPRPDTARKIEMATGGEVTRMELLYPEDEAA